MKGFAVGISENSKDLLLRLKNTEFIDEIFIASSVQVRAISDSAIKKVKVKDFLSDNWNNMSLLIFIGSLSASVRLINPFLRSKDLDPPVIVINNDCSKIIPLLGSHQSNAQNISYQIASLIGGEVIDTSNSFKNNFLNLDEFGLYWGWKRSGLMKDWSKLVILQAKKSKIYFKQTSGNNLWRRIKGSEELISLDTDFLGNSDSIFNIGVDLLKNSWHPPVLWIGIGCERNTPKEFIDSTIKYIFDKKKLSLLSVAGLATIDIKQDEKAFLEISRERNWPIKYFSSDQLLAVSVPNPSQVVFDEIGTYSVAEASSLIAAGYGANLIQSKEVIKNREFGAVTIAIAQGNKQFAPSAGEVHIIGSGPGDISYLTNDAKKALSKCSIWIGYKMYLDLIESLRREDQVRIDSELTEEKSRCKKAISLAEEGIKVAIISSGDAGIYGMAGLVLELLQSIEKKYRPNFMIHPGISSFQMAASIAGAPLMNDFCVISLSDKLTIWTDIENRIKGALQGDFVIAVFNPQSNERDWQLKRFLELCLKVRDKETPVLLARQVGRDKQTSKFYNLINLPISEVDMVSILIVGNSKTKLKDNIFVNPRGYL